ncbi:MAG: hypothetical protein K2X38_04310 [Gemmataceae bacterium]|nr:hypothetical protein [Gemmataceae bacterium]
MRLKTFACSHPKTPDAVTLKECGACQHRPFSGRTLLLRHHLSPGDVLVMTAAIHSLHKAHPGKFRTAVETSADAIFEHNPDVITKADALAAKAERIEMHYPAINECNQRAIHFMQGFCEHLGVSLGVPLPLLTNRPHVYLSDQEKGWMHQVQEVTKRPTKYWLVCAGRKGDYTAKFWGLSAYQSVVDRLRGKVQFVQIGASDHHHPPLRGVLNLVGKTNLRQLIRLAWHAQGGLGGVTLLQHLMAAHEKPYACILGGREPVTWNTYPRQQTFHAIGALDCCQSGGCWKSRVVPLGDKDEKDNSLCRYPTFGEEAVPKCMAMISPAEVADRIAAFA